MQATLHTGVHTLRVQLPTIHSRNRLRMHATHRGTCAYGGRLGRRASRGIGRTARLCRNSWRRHFSTCTCTTLPKSGPKFPSQPGAKLQACKLQPSCTRGAATRRVSAHQSTCVSMGTILNTEHSRAAQAMRCVFGDDARTGSCVVPRHTSTL